MSEIFTTTPLPTKLDTNEMITSVVSLPEYKRSREEGYTVSRSIARAALEHTGMRHTTEPLESDTEDTYEPPLENAPIDTIRYALIGELPSFIHGVEGIRAFHEGDQVDKKTYSSMKGRVARFNHTVKALIEHDTSLNFSNVKETVATLYGLMNRERWAGDRAGYEHEVTWFMNRFDERLRGMQQEVLAHQIIETINSVSPVIDPETKQKYPRVAVDTNVSVEDDLRGADMYVTLDGVTFPIDIKASERTAENTRKKSRYPASIITTGVSTPELCGAFRINTKRARKTAPGILQKLYAARAEYLELHPEPLQSHQLAA